MRIAGLVLMVPAVMVAQALVAPLSGLKAKIANAKKRNANSRSGSQQWKVMLVQSSSGNQ
jgi:hypothetical protein